MNSRDLFLLCVINNESGWTGDPIHYSNFISKSTNLRFGHVAPLKYVWVVEYSYVCGLYASLLIFSFLLSDDSCALGGWNQTLSYLSCITYLVYFLLKWIVDVLVQKQLWVVESNYEFTIFLSTDVNRALRRLIWNVCISNLKKKWKATIKKRKNEKGN